MAIPRSPPAEVLTLLQAALAGDRMAQERFTRHYLLPVVDAAVSRYLFGKSERYFAREDVVQEVLLHLVANDWAKLRQYDAETGTLISFLFSVVKNWIRDHLLRVLPPPEPVAEPERDLPPDSGPEWRVLLTQIVERALDDDDGDALLLFRWFELEGRSRKEIASAFDVSIEVIYKRIREMEKKVKAVLKSPLPTLDRRKP